MSRAKQNLPVVSMVEKLANGPFANLADRLTTCSGCRHWHGLARPMNGEGVDLSRPQVGECRAHPPSVILPRPDGGLQVMYLRLPSDCPACGECQPKE